MWETVRPARAAISSKVGTGTPGLLVCARLTIHRSPINSRWNVFFVSGGLNSLYLRIASGLGIGWCARPFLQAIKHQFHAGRNSQLIEDSKQIIAHDLLLGLGWSSRRVALAIYVLTAAMCTVAWLILKCDFTHPVLLCAASIGALTMAAVRLGILRSNERPRRQFRAVRYRDLREGFAKSPKSDS